MPVLGDRDSIQSVLTRTVVSSIPSGSYIAITDQNGKELALPVDKLVSSLLPEATNIDGGTASTNIFASEIDGGGA